MTSKNIYQKLMSCRLEMQRSPMKKSGKNSFAKYKYFELGDFLPHAQEVFEKHQLCPLVSFESEQANLLIVDIENPTETILFTSPMSEAKLKGCHPVQNIGAVETYQRRYLYMTALEIVEHDALDSSEPVTSVQEPQDPTPKRGKAAVSPASASSFLSTEEVKEWELKLNNAPDQPSLNKVCEQIRNLSLKDADKVHLRVILKEMRDFLEEMM